MTPKPVLTDSDRKNEYVLGTGADELERLALQHRFWSDAAHQAWRTAKIRIAQRVLDVGCGPGYASFDLAQLVTRQGAVVGIDESSSFIDYLNWQSNLRGLSQLRGLVGDVQNLSAVLHDEPDFDLAFARWVLCFVPDPASVIREVASKLKPGGRFVIHDYFNYQSFTVAPRTPVQDIAVNATMESWRARGGNTDVAGEIPRLLQEVGLQLEQTSVHARMARPDETMFQWPLIWWRIYAPKLVTMGFLSQSDCDQLLYDFEHMQHQTDQFVQCPLVYEFIARRLP
jgi:SAM-dependent methyltransferase